MLSGGNIMADTLRLSPDVCAYPDDKYENLQIEVVLPGVEKKDISFEISEDGFYVKATKEGVECADSYSICCPVNLEKAVANYSKWRT
jgi:HSP20 family protein